MARPFALLSSVRARIAVVAFIPLLGMSGFAGETLWESRSAVTRMTELSDLSRALDSVSSLIHALQKERGLSSLYLASQGARMKAELGPSQQQTAGMTEAFATAMARLTAHSTTPELTKKLDMVKLEMTVLEAKRGEITQLTAKVPEAAGRYTSMIARLLDLAGEISKHGADGSVAGAISAYLRIMQAKEAAGVERAVGVAGFEAGKFDPSGYARFQSLGAVQRSFVDSFKIYASPEQQAYLDATIIGPVVATVEGLRKTVGEGGLSGELKGVTGEKWFAATSERIDLFRKVEEYVASDLGQQVRSLQDASERAFWIAGLVALGLLGATLAAALAAGNTILRPLLDLEKTMRRLAAGDARAEVPAMGRRDEIGDMARAVEVFRNGEVERKRLEQAQAEAQAAQARRTARIEELVRGFDVDISRSLQDVNHAANGLRATADGMAAAIGDGTASIAAVSASSSEASANVQTVASAAEELSASIREIAAQVGRSHEIVSQAAEEAQRTDGTVTSLTEAAQRIGDVVKLIADIASQTNLLALNATIEAARAGDAGKGFAVVASEVKALASQTAKATEDIQAHIGSIQAVSTEAAAAIRSIGTTVTEVKEISTAIAAAVEEQGAATSEIARNVQAAAAGAAHVSHEAARASQASHSTSAAVGQVLAASEGLNAQAQSVEARVSAFLRDIQAT